MPLPRWAPWTRELNAGDKEGWFGLFVGGHGSGKSRCIRSILPKIDAYLGVQRWIAYCGSRGSHEMLEGLIEPSFRWKPPNEQELRTLVDKREAEVELWHAENGNVPPPLMGIIIDDCGYNQLFTHIVSPFATVVNNMRHLGLIVLMAVQAPQHVHGTFLSQVDFLAVMGDLSSEEEDILYKRIFRGRMEVRPGAAHTAREREALTFRLNELKVYGKQNPGRRMALMVIRGDSPQLQCYEWEKNPRVTSLGWADYVHFARMANRHTRPGYTARQRINMLSVNK